MIGLAFVSLLATTSYAANHFVRAGATGNGSGSDWTNAMAALPSALVRGDTYYIADGTYGSYIFDDPESGSAVITLKKATLEDHGTSVGWNDSYGDGEALFTSGTQSVFIFRTGHYDLNGMKGQGKTPGQYGFRAYSTASRCSGPDLVVLAEGYGTIKNVSFRHIDFDYNNGTGTCVDNVTVLIFIPAQADSITIEKSYFHHSSGFAFYIGPYDPRPGGALESNFTIRDNYFYANGGGGGESAHWELMWLMNLDNSLIVNNVMEDTLGSSGQTGWVMIGKTDNLRIEGNLFFCSSSNCIVGGNGVVATWSHDWCQNSAIHIVNNTFVNLVGVFTPQIYFIHNTVSDSDIRVVNNLYYNAKFNWAGINQQTNDACGGGQGCAGTNQQTGITTAQFVNFAGKDFRLARATNAGSTALGPYNNDLFGNARGADGVLDRGAYEYVSGATVPTPTPASTPTPTPIATATPIPSPIVTPVPTATAVPTAPPSTAGETLLGTSSPAILAANDGVAYELGMKFSSVSAGKISAIRFYKSPSEAGSHTGKIYSSTGALLASVTFTNESASGWQTAVLSTPLSITGNTVYTVSVNTGANYYVATNGDFAAQKSSANLRAPVAAGVYGGVGAMPTKTWNNSNYFRDVVFVPSTAAPAPTATPVSSATPVPTATSGDTVKPTTAITSPANNSQVSRSKSSKITASATDNVAVTRVEFYVNGVLKCTEREVPYECYWTVPSTLGATYSLQTKAYDAAGNVGVSAVIQVTAR
jgi:hypothetical protein